MPIATNPYIAGNPVGNNSGFVGRDDVLRDVLRVLRSPNQNAITLFGQRRIGKTSVLQSLEARLPGEGPYQPVYFDLMDKAAWPLERVLAELARNIASKLGLPHPSLEGNVEVAFRQSWLPRVMASLPAETSLVLLFDEFDVLADQKVGQAVGSFFPYLRDLLLMDSNRVQFVFVLGRNVTDLDSIALSLFKGIPSKRVSLLLERDARKLVQLSEARGSLKWTDAAVQAVWALTHGHPYLTQTLCYQVWETAYENGDPQAPVAAQDVEAAIPAALDASRNTLEWLWDGLGPAERVVISALAQVGATAVDEMQLEQVLRESGVRILIRELQNAPQVLQDWDLIEPADGGYCFRVELLRCWIVAHRPLSRVQEELDRIQPLAESLYQSAEGFYRGKNISQTETLLRQAISVNPNHVRANELLAELLIGQGKLTHGMEILENLYEFSPQVARPRLVQVYLLQAKNTDNQESRRKLFEKVIGVDSTQPEAHAGLESIQKLEQEEKELAFRFVEGRQALQHGEWTRAVEQFQWVVCRRPSYRYDDENAVDLLADAVRQKAERTPRWKTFLRRPQTLAFLGGSVFVLLLALSVGIGAAFVKYGAQGVGPFKSLATPTITLTSTVTFTPTHTYTPTYTPMPQLGDLWTRPADGMVMIYIPAGSFQMGSDDGNSDELPVHTVYLDGYWMDQSEVTNAMFSRCVQMGGCSTSGGNYYGDEFYADYPVVYVDWNDAQIYCEWAGSNEYMTRLPTEAEWERSARGGIVDGIYPWGNDDPVCLFGASNGAQYDRCDKSIVSILSFAPNDFGFYDMAGNVLEWVSDWYNSDYYGTLGENPENPMGPVSGKYRVLRGGSWVSTENALRVALRNGDYPDNASLNVGFRCSRSP